MTQIRKEIDLKFPLFEEGLKKEIEENGFLRTFEEGELVMSTGQYFKHTVLIISGQLKVYREGEDGGELFMYFIEEGDSCALSMICAMRQEQSEIKAKTVEKTEILFLPISLMDEWMKTYRTWYYFVLETYRNRFEELLGVVDQVVFKGMDERLHFYLKQKVKQLDTNVLTITHQEIATDLNSSREVISRLLKKMENVGMVHLSRNSIQYLE